MRRQLLSDRVQLLTLDNLVVLNVHEKPFEGFSNVYEGIEREHASVLVNVAVGRSKFKLKRHLDNTNIPIALRGATEETGAYRYLLELGASVSR